MANIPPPVRVDSPRKTPKAGVFSRKNFLGVFDLSDCRHSIKLRNKWKASDQLNIEIGADCTRQECRPWVGVCLLLDPEKPDDGWAMEVNTDMAILQFPTKDISPFPSRFSLPVNARIGTNFYEDNSPHVEIGVKNKTVILGLLACSLALQKPMAIHVKKKEVGGYECSVPCNIIGAKTDGVFQQKFELDGSLRRQGWRLMVKLDEVSPVCRFLN